ncbi:conserved hypothetical protein, partial [Trichinella spiralis]
MIRPAIVCQLK